jgi:hypothetical protein
MSKTQIFSPIIKNILYKKSHNLKELINESKKELKDNKRFNNKKFNKNGFYEALTKLLKENKIVLSGYDFNIHNTADNRIQSLKKEGIIFEWNKTDHADIYSLLNQMESLDISKSEESKNRLKNCFKRKFREFEKKEEEFFNSLSLRVKFFSAKNEYEKDLKYLNKIAQAKYESNKKEWEKHVHPQSKPGEEWKGIPELKKFLKDLLKLRSKYKSSEITKKSKLWVIPDLTIDEARKILIKKYSKKSYFYNENELLWNMKEKDYNSYLEELALDKLFYIDLDGNLNPDKYLKIFYSTQKKSDKEIGELFNIILFYINTHENYKSLKHYFSLALSDENGSMDWFELFLNYVQNIRFYLKLQQELGIKNPKMGL